MAAHATSTVVGLEQQPAAVDAANRVVASVNASVALAAAETVPAAAALTTASISAGVTAQHDAEPVGVAATAAASAALQHQS